MHRACYAELCPDLELPQVEAVPGAHTALADHRAARPRYLVRITDLRVLLRLAELETTGRCYLREVIAEQERRWGDEAPDWVAKIPAGLLPGGRSRTWPGPRRRSTGWSGTPAAR